MKKLLSLLAFPFLFSAVHAQGSFQEQTININATNVVESQVIDWDKDGDMDIVTRHSDGTFKLWLHKVDLTTGLLAYYNFEASNNLLNDTSGNNHHAIQGQNSNVTFASSAKVGNGAASLDGNLDYFYIQSHADFAFNGDFSVAYWVKYDMVENNPNSPQQGMYRHDNNTVLDSSGSYGAISMALLSGENWSVVSTAGSGSADQEQFISLSEGPNTTEWYHISLVKKDQVLYLYINGDLKGSRAHAVPVPQGIQYFGVTHKLGDSVRMMNGSLDDVRIYNRALDVLEINALRGL